MSDSDRDSSVVNIASNLFRKYWRTLLWYSLAVILGWFGGMAIGEKPNAHAFVKNDDIYWGNIHLDTPDISEFNPVIHHNVIVKVQTATEIIQLDKGDVVVYQYVKQDGAWGTGVMTSSFLNVEIPERNPEDIVFSEALPNPLTIREMTPTK